MRLLLAGNLGFSNEQHEELKNLGYELLIMPDEREVCPFPAKDIDVIVCNGFFLYNDITLFQRLKMIQLTSAGLDRAPLEYIHSRGIKLFNAKGVYSIPMAEFALCGVLQLYKQSAFFNENRKVHKWVKHRDLVELSGKNVLILGAGSVGIECAKRFKAMGCHVVGIDLYPTNQEHFDAIFHLDLLMERLLEADIVILTLPLTEKTEGMINKTAFSVMKKDSILVNIARGRIVNQRDLIKALETKEIGGAVLDVFEEEPLDENSVLWDMDNVLITPHNSFVSGNNNMRMFSLLKENLGKI